jgi:hypothetical protein
MIIALKKNWFFLLSFIVFLLLLLLLLLLIVVIISKTIKNEERILKIDYVINYPFNFLSI